MYSKIFFLAFLVQIQSLSAQSPAASYLKIQQLLAPYGEKAGVSIADLSGKVLYESNASTSFSPASVAKTLSTACVLESLGADFHFETPWYRNGEIKNGVLEGDLVISGRGDFSFVIEDLKMITEYLRFNLGIREITGRLVFETSFLESPSIDLYEGFDGDRGRAFKTSITSLPINHNAFSIWVLPDQPQPRIEISPRETIDLKIENKLKLGPGRLGGSQTNLDFRPKTQQLIMSGRVGKADPARIYYRALPDPYEAFARLFAYNFQLMGGKWNGKWVSLPQSPKSAELWVHRSRTISRLLIDINKLSTNFGAEMALLAATQKAMSGSASPAKATQFLSSCLASFGISSSEISLENASGLSRSSRFQPKALTQFLSKLSDKAYFPEFLSTLAVLGQDGTMRSRLQQHQAKARLKTGTLNDVRSIAGYVFPSDTMPLSISLVLNCKNCDFNRWKAVEDQILAILIQGT